MSVNAFSLHPWATQLWTFRKVRTASTEFGGPRGPDRGPNGTTVTEPYTSGLPANRLV